MKRQKKTEKSCSSSKSRKSTKNRSIGFEKIKKAHEAIKRTREEEINKKSYSLIESLICRSRVLYADQKKEFIIVRTKYFEELQRVARMNKRTFQNLSPEIDIFCLRDKAIDIRLKQKDERLENLRQQNEKLHAKYASIQNYCLSLKRINVKQSQEIQKLVNEYSSIKQQRKQIQKDFQLFKDKTLQKQSQIDEIMIQTEILFEICQENKGNQVQIQNEYMHELFRQKQEKVDHQKELKDLTNKFEGIIANLEKKVEEKMQELKSVMIKNQRCKLENEQLWSENLQLKSQVKQINEKEIKIEVWKNSIRNFLHKIDKQCIMNGQQSLQEDQKENDQNFSQFSAQEKIMYLENKVDSLLKQKVLMGRNFSIINKVMRMEQVDEGDNFTQQFMRLSMRIEKSVKNLLENA